MIRFFTSIIKGEKKIVVHYITKTGPTMLEKSIQIADKETERQKNWSL